MKKSKFSAPKKDKQTLPFMLEIPYKEAVKQEICRLYSEQQEPLNPSIQRELDFWLVTFEPEFLTKRCPEYIAKLVIESDELIQTVKWEISTNPERRAQAFVAIPSTVVSVFSSKNSVGCLLGLQVDPSCERVARKDIENAVKACHMGFELLNAFYRRHLDPSSIDIFYFEIGCQENEAENSIDLSLFKKTFLEKIENHIQKVVPALFMQRNEEERIKNLLVLRKEICSIEDIPQMMILYDQHTAQEITFTIVLARVKKRGDLPLQDLLKLDEENAAYIQGQTCSLGTLCEEHNIEGNIFQIQVKNLSRFQKENASIDYNLSRKEISALLQAGLGEVRDYTGGLFIKQDEQFEELKKACPKRAAKLLESFFYSMQPVEKQLTLPTELLALFFELFQKLFIEDQIQLLTKTSDLILLIAFTDKAKTKGFEDEESLLKSKISYKTIVSSQWFYGNFSFKGWILSFDTIDHLQQYEKEFREKITQMSSCKAPQQKILHINGAFNQLNFDPRIDGMYESAIISKLLFEGLTRLNKKGEAMLACADSYELSSDEKTYTFQLKELHWSNGQPLIAADFARAWKKVLCPDAKTTFDYFFDSILNAQQAKAEKISPDAVGVKILSNTKLEIQLNQPVPYFLKILAHPVFSPIYSDVDKNNLSWGFEKNHHLVCNGPFRLQRPRPFYGSELKKNLYYRNQEHVTLDGISISTINPQKLLKIFKNQQTGCLESPFGDAKKKFYRVFQWSKPFTVLKSLFVLFQCTILPIVQ
ncbi:MAG: ABC transporter substrate-binding protein [Simkaniaceae bacterium]|nr:ABC transporter substrate-binding protein [Simkaniaceae bacterium]